MKRTPQGEALGTAAVALGAVTTAKAIPIAGEQRADLIYAAIINHRSASKAYFAASVAYGQGDESPAMTRRIAELHDCEIECLAVLAACKPATLESAAELLNYTLEILDKEGTEYFDGHLSAILTNVMLAIVKLSGTPAAGFVVGRQAADELGERLVRDRARATQNRMLADDMEREARCLRQEADEIEWPPDKGTR